MKDAPINLPAEDIHSCSYYCKRPECIKAQRDELVKRMEADGTDGRYAEPPAAPVPCVGVDYVDGKLFVAVRIGNQVVHCGPVPEAPAAPVQQEPIRSWRQDAEMLRTERDQLRALLQEARYAIWCSAKFPNDLQVVERIDAYLKGTDDARAEGKDTK